MRHLWVTKGEVTWAVSSEGHVLGDTSQVFVVVTAAWSAEQLPSQACVYVA